MPFSPLSSLHSVALLGALAFSPFGGCDEHDSIPPSSLGTAEQPRPVPDPVPLPGGGGPSGGVPEPATMLLVAGGAASYVALRRRRKNGPDLDAGGDGV